MLNHSRLFWICAISVLALTLSSGCSKQAKLERYLKRADRYFDAKQYNKAEVEYLNALRLQPTNRFVVKRLSTIYFEQGKIRPAMRFSMGAFVMDKEDAEAHVRLGQMFLSGGELKAARKEAAIALDRQATNEMAMLMLADAARTPEEIAEAHQRLQAIRAQAENQAPFHLALASLYLRQTNMQAAEGALRKALSLQPDSGRVHMAWGNFYWQQGDLKKADQSFQKAAELSPARSSVRMRQVEFKMSTGAAKEARDLLQQITKEAPDAVGAWQYLARMAFDGRKYQDCSDILNRILAQDSDNLDARLLRARVKRIEGKLSEAIKELEELQPAHPRVAEVPLLLASAHVQNRDPQKAMTCVRQALTIDPNSIPAALLFAEISLELGDPLSAITSMRDLLKKHPDVGRAYFLLATAYTAQGRLEDTLAVYTSLEKKAPTNSGIAFLKGATLRQLNRNAEARKAFQTAFDLATNDLLVINQLVDLDMLDKSYSTALQRVRQYLANNPRAAGAKLLEAKIFLVQTNLNEAEAALKKAIELAPDLTQAYGFLADLYLGSQRLPQALKELEQLLSHNPKDVKALMLTAMIHSQNGEVDKAAKEYEDLLKVNPKFLPALNNLAGLLSRKLERIDDAYTYASKAREIDPQDPQIADTMGWVLYRRREYSRALALFQESVGKSPNQPQIQFHLGMAHYMMGQDQPARMAFKRALELNQNFPGRDEAQSRLALLDADPKALDQAAISKLQDLVKRQPDDLLALLRLGQAYERSGAPDKARQAYEDARKVNSNSVPVLVQLAQLYSGALKDSKQALALAREARKLAPEDPQIAHVLGRLAWQQGDQLWASSLLQESAQKLPNDSEVLYDLSQAWYSVGRVADAEETMRRARQAGPAFAHEKEAQWFLTLLDYCKNPDKRLGAESQVQQVLAANPGYLPALMVAALIEEQRGKVAEAKQSYEKILERHPRFVPAKKQLAAIYTDLGDQQKAQEYANKAREVLTDDPELAKTLGKIAYRRADYRNAVRFLQECSRKQAGDAEVLYFLGMAHYQLKQKNESKEALAGALALNAGAPFAQEARKTLAELK